MRCITDTIKSKAKFFTPKLTAAHCTRENNYNKASITQTRCIHVSTYISSSIFTIINFK